MNDSLLSKHSDHAHPINIVIENFYVLHSNCFHTMFHPRKKITSDDYYNLMIWWFIIRRNDTYFLHVKIELFHINIFFSCILNSHHLVHLRSKSGLEEKTWMIYCTNVMQFSCVFLFIVLPIELRKFVFINRKKVIHDIY